MINLSKEQKIVVFIACVIILFVISYYIFQKMQSDEYEVDEGQEFIIPQNENVDTNSISAHESPTEEIYIIVHIAGSIKNSGIIKVKENARISDIISLAGGLTEDSDISRVNLAYKVEDGQKIYIPSMADKDIVEHYVTLESGEGVTQQGNVEKQTTVNINTANQTELELLPGVGPSTALNIIKYREDNGKYKTIEDIKNVPGIGDSKFDAMKEFIKVK